jgi:hypothetical protein
MRKILIPLGAALAIGIVVVNAKTNTPEPSNTETPAQPQIEIPAYAKWSKIAIQETQKKYPDAKVIDYLHEGSETSGNHTIEKFKLWLKGSNKEFGVFVRIKYVTKTEELVTIEFQETSK